MRNLSKIALLGVVFLVCVVFALKGSALLVLSGTWAPAANLAEPRAGASAALLADGRIFITGGEGTSGALATAEMFGMGGSVSPAAPMNVARSKHISVVLQDGRVLVAGGTVVGGGVTNAAEIYDPATNSWSSLAGGMTEARSGATAALLLDGRVLIAGGDNAGVASSTIEIFDPASSTFSFAGALPSPRENHAMALLADGRALIVGGFNGSAPLASTDIFDPAAASVAPGPSLAAPRFGHSATTLLDGRVLVAGGSNGQTDLTSAEIFDPSAGTFSPATSALATPRQGHLAFLLPHNNNVLIVGGTSAGAPVAASELFTPWQGTFAGTGALTTARSSASGSAMQQDGLLLVAGGSDANGAALASAELYGFATVKTDQADYSPGTTVTITGSGWQPGETVTLSLVEWPLIDTHAPLTAVADANGNIFNSQFSPDAHDIGILFYLTATGAASQAQTKFLDSGSLSYSPSTTQNLSANAGGPSVSFSQSVTAPANNGAFSASLQVAATGTNPIPANWVSTSPTSSLSFSTGGSGHPPSGGSDDTKSWTVSFAVPPGTAAGTYTASIKANPSIGGIGVGPGSPVSLTVSVPCTAPSITANPASATKTVGDPATFSVTASGTAPLSYQWRKGGVPISGATSSSFTIASVSLSDAGSYDVVITNGCGSATSTATTLTVNKKSQTISFGALIDKTYGDPDFNVSATATSGLTVTFTASGSCTVTGTLVHITGAGSCTISAQQPGDSTTWDAAPDIPQTFAITAKTLTASIIGDPTKPYDGSTSATLTPANFSLSGVVSGESFTVTKASGTYNSKDVATANTVTAGLIATDFTPGAGTLASNYTLPSSASGAGHITPLTVTVTPDAGQTKTYGGADPTLTYGFTPALITGDSFSGFLARDPGVNVGFYNITQGTLALSTNYTLTFTAGVQFEIKKLTVTVTPDSGQFKIYGSADPTLTYGFTPALITGDSFSGFLARDPGVNVGFYNITQGTLALSTNYTLTFTAGVQFEIKPRSITVTADAKTKVLGAPDPALTYQITSGSLVIGDTFTGSLTRTAGENVGSYAILQGTLALSSNYYLTYIGANLTITYATSGTCLGSPGHQILQPIDLTGASVFPKKQGSTVPAKFRVCDFTGNSIGTPGVVTGFKIVQIISGTGATDVNDVVTSTTPDSAFRFDTTAMQWIFNISTKNLSAGYTYYFRVWLNDGSNIDFAFGLK